MLIQKNDPDLVRSIKKHEGWSPSAYQDSEGYWTIGYGRLIDARLNGGITEQEGEFLLATDISGAIGVANFIFPDLRTFTINRQRALVEMTFNLGRSRLLTFKKMIAAIEARDWEAAADEALDSKWAKQVGPKRSGYIARLLREG